MAALGSTATRVDMSVVRRSGAKPDRRSHICNDSGMDRVGESLAGEWALLDPSVRSTISAIDRLLHPTLLSAASRADGGLGRKHSLHCPTRQGPTNRPRYATSVVTRFRMESSSSSTCLFAEVVRWGGRRCGSNTTAVCASGGTKGRRYAMNNRRCRADRKHALPLCNGWATRLGERRRLDSRDGFYPIDGLVE